MKSKEKINVTFLTKKFDNVPKDLISFCVKNNITKIPKCIVCNNKVSFNKAYPSKGFNLCCSSKCRAVYKSNTTLKKSSYKKLKDKNWLYNERIINMKSKELIAKELQCSITPINKWLKIHNIPNVKLNESHPIIKFKLGDKNWLFNEYKNKNKTCELIAKELGFNCSKSLVSVWLNLHNIDSDNPNSYPRKINKISNEEKRIVEYINSIYNGKIIKNNRSILGGMELDIYLPELKIAFEYNGFPWHTEQYGKDRLYHIGKTLNCEKKGIQLIHFFSHDWLLKEDICKSMICNKLKKNKIKIFARQCKVKEISTNEKRLFLENNHIQGNDSSLIKLGLLFNNEIVSLMTFRTPRYNKKCEWELVRFCNKKYTNIIGSFSKLLKHFINKQSPKTIISYADKRYSNGDIYKKFNFDLIKTNPPSYHYVNSNNVDVSNRYSYQKKRLKILLSNYNENLTEKENMINNNWKRYWDCGTLSFVLHVS